MVVRLSRRPHEAAPTAAVRFAARAAAPISRAKALTELRLNVSPGSRRNSGRNSCRVAALPESQADFLAPHFMRTETICYVK